MTDTDAATAKLEKQKAFLAPHLASLLVMKETTIPMFKYYGKDVSEQEKELDEYQKILDIEAAGDKLPPKADIVRAINGVESLQGYLLYLMMEVFMNIEQYKDIHPEYLKDFYEIDPARQKYLEKLSKAFNRQKKGGPGFDGVKHVK